MCPPFLHPIFVTPTKFRKQYARTRPFSRPWKKIYSTTPTHSETQISVLNGRCPLHIERSQLYLWRGGPHDDAREKLANLQRALHIRWERVAPKKKNHIYLPPCRSSFTKYSAGVWRTAFTIHARIFYYHTAGANRLQKKQRHYKPVQPWIYNPQMHYDHSWRGETAIFTSGTKKGL